MLDRPPVATLPSSIWRFSTEAFAPDERASAWREAYGRTIARLELAPVADGPFAAEATLRMLPGLGLVSTTTDKLNWHIPKSLLECDDLLLIIVETGSWVCSERGQDIYLKPGDATICLNSETASGTTSGRRSMLRVPLKAITPLVGDITQSLDRPIPHNTPLLRLLSPYVRALQDDTLGPDVQPTAVTHIHDLLALLVGATRDGAELARNRGLRAARLKAIKDDIARDLAADLSVSAIARRHRVTPRYVQMLFEADGATFSEYVTGQRLAWVHRMLTHGSRDKIASIAFDAGFSDLSYFYRVFRRRYGVSPADLRAPALRG